MVLCRDDMIRFRNQKMEEFIREICDRTGLQEAAVFIHVTHTHTSGPFFEPDTKDEKILHYRRVLRYKLADAAEMALQDLKPAKMATAHGEAPGIAFIRRYVMKDGSIKTNPGVNNPEIDHPVGETDNEVTMLRFDREDAETLVLVNFGCHPDTIGGTKLSAARYIHEMHLAGRDAELPYKEMELTTMVAEAGSSRYKAGAAELIIENGCRMLESLLPDSSENILR